MYSCLALLYVFLSPTCVSFISGGEFLWHVLHRKSFTTCQSAKKLEGNKECLQMSCRKSEGAKCKWWLEHIMRCMFLVLIGKDLQRWRIQTLFKRRHMLPTESNGNHILKKLDWWNMDILANTFLSSGQKIRLLVLRDPQQEQQH